MGKMTRTENLPILLSLLAVTIAIVNSQSPGCEVVLKGFSSSETGTSRRGYIQVNGIDLVSFLPNPTTTNSFYLALITHSCQDVSDKVDIPRDHQVNIDEFGQRLSNVLEHTPRGYIILGASADDASIGLDDQAKRTLTYLGLDIVGDGISTGGVLLFAARKGFPSQTSFVIREASATTLPLTVTFGYDLHAGQAFPPMQEFPDFTGSTQDTHVMITRRFTGSGKVTGWYYDAKVAGTGNFGVWRFEEIVEGSGGTAPHDDAGIVAVGSNSVEMKQGGNFYWVPENERITVEKDNLIGCFFGSSGAGQLAALTQQEVDGYNKNEDPHRCGLPDVTFYDLVYGVRKSGFSASQPTASDFTGIPHSNMLVALHPITSPNFVYTAPCSDDTFCQSLGDENMECNSGSCACRSGYSYYSPYDICILDTNVAGGRPVSISAGGSGSAVTDGKPSCTANTPSTNPFMVIDLGREFLVYSVKINTGNGEVTPISDSQTGISSNTENTAEEVVVTSQTWKGKPCVSITSHSGAQDVVVGLVSSTDVTFNFDNDAPFTGASVEYSLTGAQLRDFTIGVSSTYGGDSDLSSFQPCLHMPSALADNSEKELTCTDVHKGRYISISIETSENEVIPICELEAYGIPDDMYNFDCDDDTDCQSPGDSTIPRRSVGMVCSAAKKCECGTGYKFENDICVKEDVDYCKDVPCQNNGVCTSGADGYSCECQFGWEGKECSELVTGHLYPFGKSTEDKVMFDKDDVAVEFSPDNLQDDGFIFGCKRYSSIYVSDNGYVSFGKPVYLNNPNAIDNINIPYIGPLVIDAHLGPSEDGDSVVYYNSYTHQKQKLDTGSVDYYMFQRAKDDMKKKFGNTNFNPTQMVVITWSKVTPWPFSSTTSEKNTFQLVLLQDQVSLESYFINLYGALNWNGNVRANAVAYKGDPQRALNFGSKNAYSGTPLAFSLNVIQGNRGYDATWVYKGDATNCVDPNSPEYKCRAWYSQQNIQRSVLLNNFMPLCPCQRWQAWWHPRFARYSSSNLCYVTTSRYWVGNRLETGTRECCYSWWGWIQGGQTYSAGSIFNNNPFYYYQNWIQEDILPKQWCCLESNLCHLYYARRPATRWCSNLFWLAFFWGDPHITTLDGLGYDFNGKGEYWLIKSDNFTLQGRTAPALDDKGQPTKATVFSGFAGQDTSDATIPVVNILMTTDRKEMEVHINNMQLEWKDYNISKPYIKDGLSISDSNSSVVVQFPSGVGLTVSIAEEQLSVTIATTDSMINNTQGLLGVFNQDKADDLTDPDGNILPADSTDKEIYYNFGEKWRITSDETIFLYLETNKGYREINDKEFVPLFKSDIKETIDSYSQEEKEKIQTLCKGNEECEYDYVLTGKESVAENTLKDSQSNKEVADRVANEIPTVNVTVKHGDKDVVSNELWTTVNTEVTLTVEGFDVEDSNVELSVENLPQGATFDNNTGIMTWTPTDLTPQKDLRFFATDESKAISNPVEMIIKICDCNDHGKCDYKVLAEGQFSNETFQITQCICRPPWEGEDCSQDVDWCETYKPCLDDFCEDNPADKHNETEISHKCTQCPNGTVKEGKETCRDIDECLEDTHDCEQKCVNTFGSYECDCHSGYALKGGSCEDINECEARTHSCDHECKNEVGRYSCRCKSGYTLHADGLACVQDDDTATACEGKVCVDGYCFMNGDDPVCGCPEGFDPDGDTCKDIDECTENAGNADKCDDNSVCNNTKGSYECNCKAGYKATGDRRTCDKCDYTWGPNCENPCTCRNSTTVCDPANGCKACEDGWEGGSCNEDIDECSMSETSCPEHSKCDNTPGSFTCTCNENYEFNGEGLCKAIDLCEIATEPLCQNGGLCVFNNENLTTSCDCEKANGFTGEMCEIDEDECANGHECKNGATCEDGKGFYRCLCTNETYGVMCENRYAISEPTGGVPTGLLAAILGSIAGILLISFVVIVVLFMCRQSRTRRFDDDDDTESSYSRETGSMASTLPRSARNYWQPWTGAFVGHVWNNKNPHVNPYRDASKHTDAFQQARKPHGPTPGYSGMMLPRLQRNAGRSPAGRKNYQQEEQFGWNPVS